MRPTAVNASRVVKALERFGYTNGEFEEADFTTVPNFLSFAADGVWFDLMTQLLGVSFDDCATGSLEAKFADVPVCYSSLAALRETKRVTGRPQDLRDLENLPDSE